MSKKCKPGCNCHRHTLSAAGAARELMQVRWATGGLVSGPANASEPVPPKPADFHGLDTFDFAIGEVYGLRVWKVDEYGRLRALHLDYVEPWRPGVNVAKCNVERPAAYYGGRGTWTVNLFITAYGHEVSCNCKQTPNEKCRCGFYAYTYTGHQELSKATETDHVLGMVKGTGRTLIGTKGFRCEKAEIVALLDPTHLTPLRRDAIRSVYPDVPVLPNIDSLLGFAPLSSTLPEVGSDDFWALP